MIEPRKNLLRLLLDIGEAGLGMYEPFVNAGHRDVKNSQYVINIFLGECILAHEWIVA